MSGELERIWRERAGTAWSGEESLESSVDRLVREARATFPFEAPRAAFVAVLATAYAHALRKGDNPELSGLATDDLYLSVAVLERLPDAVTAFNDQVGADLERVIRRLVPADERADVRQRLDTRLLVGDEGKPPALEKYRGSGSLRAWVRAVATRALIDEQRARARTPGMKPWVSHADAAPEQEVEMRVALGKHAQTIRAVLQEAFAGLTVRQRNLIRYSLFHGLGIDELAALYGVHRATAARWLQRARTDLSERVEQGFAANVGGPAGDAASLLRQLRSRIDVSIRSFLASSLEAEPDTDPQ